jgi:hypothetical protein
MADMGKVSIWMEVNLHGAIAEGLADGIMERYRSHLEDELGNKGASMTRAYLPTQYMYLGHNGGNPKNNPIPGDAGFLVSTIHKDISVDNHTLVVQDEAIYGPWIEGIAVGNTFFWPGRVSRGMSPRFEGYHTFRKITGVLNDMAFDIAMQELPPYLHEINDY